MRTTMLIRCFLVSVLLAGCTTSRDRRASEGGARTLDSGTTVPAVDAGDADVALPDTGLPDGGPGPSLCEGDGIAPEGGAWSPLVAGDSGAAADYDCLCEEVTPTGGASVTVTLRLLDFQEGTAVEGIPVEAWSDGRAGDSCATPGCTTTVTDSAGEATVTGAEGGWLAIRTGAVDGVTPSTSHLSTINHNLQVSAGSGTEGWVMSVATANLIPTLLGFRRTSDTAIVLGQVRDCTGAPVAGARIQLVEPGGAIIPEGTASDDTHYRYFDGSEFPSSSTTATQADGLFLVANVPVPPSGSPLRLEVWGQLPGESSPRLVGAERVSVAADAATVVNPTPLRRDVGG